MAAPANPPISVCEDETGYLSTHVPGSSISCYHSCQYLADEVIYCSTVLDTIFSNTESAYYVLAMKSNE